MPFFIPIVIGLGVAGAVGGGAILHNATKDESPDDGTAPPPDNGALPLPSIDAPPLPSIDAPELPGGDPPDASGEITD